VSVLVRPYDYLLDGASGWSEVLALGVDAGDALTLRRSPSTDGAIDTATAIVERLRPKGVAALSDAVYIADETRGVIWLWEACCLLRALPEMGAEAGGPRKIAAPSALVVRNGADLIVLDERAATLHAFTLPDLALRRVVQPAIRSHPPHPGGDWEPVDLAACPDGALLVADRRGHVWRLDFQLRTDRYYRGALPEDFEPTRMAVDAEGFAYLAGTEGELIILNPRGVLVPGPEQLEARTAEWVGTHYGPDDEALPSAAQVNLRAERRKEARRALLPGDLASRLESVAALASSESTDWRSWYRAVLPSFVADRLGLPRLVPDRVGSVSLAALRPGGSPCECAPVATGLVVDGTGALKLGDAAVEHVVRLLVGSEPLTVMGSQPLTSGVVGALIDQLDPVAPDAAHLDRVFDTAQRRAAVTAVSEAVGFEPGDEHVRPSPLDSAVGGLQRWLHTASVSQLVQSVVDAAVVDATGSAVLGPDALASTIDLASALTTGGPPLTAPLDLRPFVREGVVQLGPLDSGRLGNTWHRVVLDQELPQRTSTQLFAFTSDVDRPDITATTLPETPDEPPWLAARINADEWLVQCPPGRFLHLAVVLKGTDDVTPTVSSISVYRTRHSSLKFLPAAYLEDPEGASTLDRLLSLTDTIYDEIETRIEEFTMQLGPGSADPEFLPWLASWFDLSFDPSWSLAQRRRILGEIVDIYRWRGTRRGLTKLLVLHTGLEGGLPRLVENRCARARLEHRRWIGQQSDPCGFTVLLPATAIDDENKARAIDRLLRDNIPAHADFCLRPVVPGVRLADATVAGSVVGFDTLVGGTRRWQLPVDSRSGPGSPLGRGLPGDPVSRSQGIRVGGPGHASRTAHTDSRQATCSYQEDRS
jgi:phage tail-like protein